MMNLKHAFHLLLDRATPIILDGGLATQLEAQGYGLNTSLWSAELLLNCPQAILEAHSAYLQAGAQVITTASYQASIQGFTSLGLSEDKALELILDSVRIGRKAVDKYLVNNPSSSRPLVAASIGAYGAYLADGSEYRGNYGLSHKALANFHKQRLFLLDQSKADVLACETIPSYQEAKVLSNLLEGVNTPAWVSFSCCDGQHLNDGTKISEAVSLFEFHPKVLAIGINCTAPQYVSELIEQVKSIAGSKTIIVYPNSGELYDAPSKTWISTDEAINFVTAAQTWYKQGAQIIGGCCRIGPEQIAAIAFELNPE